MLVFVLVFDSFLCKLQCIHAIFSFCCKPVCDSHGVTRIPPQSIIQGEVQFLMPLLQNSVHNVPPFHPHHSSKDLEERGIPCHFFIPMDSSLQPQGLGLDTPPKALRAPQPTSRRDHKKKASKNPSLTFSHRPRRREPPVRRKWKLSNWTTPKMIWTS